MRGTAIVRTEGTPRLISHALIQSEKINDGRQRPENPLSRDDRLQHRVRSPIVLKEVLRRHHQLKLQDRNYIAPLFHSASPLRAPLASLFEITSHDTIPQLDAIIITPMEEVDGMWRKNEDHSDDMTVLLGGLPTKFYDKNASHEYTAGDNHYYIPEESNNPTFDAFIRSNGQTVVLQMTIGRSHTVKQKGITMLRKRRVGGSKSSFTPFVFVIPEGGDYATSASVPLGFKFYILEVSTTSKILLPICHSLI